MGEEWIWTEVAKVALTNFVVGIDVLGAEKLGAEGGLSHTRGSQQQNPGKWKLSAPGNWQWYRILMMYLWLIDLKVGIELMVDHGWKNWILTNLKKTKKLIPPDNLHWTHYHVCLLLSWTVTTNHAEISISLSWANWIVLKYNLEQAVILNPLLFCNISCFHIFLNLFVVYVVYHSY